MSQEFDEDQFDGFVSSNAKSKYDYFNDIQEEQPQQTQTPTNIQNGSHQQTDVINSHAIQNNEEDFDFGEFHQQNDVVIPTLQLLTPQLNVPHLNLLPNPPQTGSQNLINIQISSQIQKSKEDVFQFAEYIEIEKDHKIIKQNQQEFFAPPQPIHQLDPLNIENILDLDQIPQKKEVTTNLMSLYDAFPPEENYTIVSPTLQVDQPNVTQNLMEIYQAQQLPIEVVQQQEIKLEELSLNTQPLKQDLFDFEEQPQQVTQPTPQIIENQQPQQQLQFLSLYEEQNNQNNKQTQNLNNLPEVHEQQVQNVEEDEFDEFVEGEQIELDQIEQQPVPINIIEQPAIEQKINIQNHVQQQVYHQHNDVNQHIVQHNFPNNIQEHKEQDIVQNSIQTNYQHINNFQHNHPVHNQSTDQQPPSIINDLKMLQDIQFGPSGPHKSTRIEKRKWRDQIEDIVGLDADCMVEYIKELEELKLDVYKQKVLEYAQLAKDIQTLRKKKQYHVDKEEYEEATVIRDTLRAKEPIAMQLKKKILEVALVMNLMDGQDLNYHIKQYLYQNNEEFPEKPSLDLLQPPLKSNQDFVGKLKKELKKSESVLSIIKLQGQLEKVRYEKKYQNFIMGLRKIIGMSYRFKELDECVRAVNDRLSDLKLEKEIHRIDYEYIFENTMIPYLKGERQDSYYCNYCFMAKKNLIEYKGKVYDVCCLNFYYNVN